VELEVVEEENSQDPETLTLLYKKKGVFLVEEEAFQKEEAKKRPDWVVVVVDGLLPAPVASP
jgi:hypothetical protein